MEKLLPLQIQIAEGAKNGNKISTSERNYDNKDIGGMSSRRKVIYYSKPLQCSDYGHSRRYCLKCNAGNATVSGVDRSDLPT